MTASPTKKLLPSCVQKRLHCDYSRPVHVPPNHKLIIDVSLPKGNDSGSIMSRYHRVTLLLDHQYVLERVIAVLGALDFSRSAMSAPRTPLHIPCIQPKQSLRLWLARFNN